MKTIKKLSFAVVTFVALSFTLSSCDMLSDALSKEIEVQAPDIDFNIGGVAQAPMQKIKLANGETKLEYTWYDKDVNLKTELEEKLKEQNLTLDNVKTLLLTESSMRLMSGAVQDLELGKISIYINNQKVVESAAWVYSYAYPNAPLTFNYSQPFPLFDMLSLGTFRLKIVSDKQVPNAALTMKLMNKYKSKISLIK